MPEDWNRNDIGWIRKNEEHRRIYEESKCIGNVYRRCSVQDINDGSG